MKKNGFSVIELLLIVLLTGFIVIILADLPSSLGLIGGSHYSSLAKDIASSVMENIRSQTYDNLANGVAQISDIRLSSVPSGSGTTTVTDCPNSICKSGEQIKQVTVQINWTEGKNSKNIKLTTFVANGGLK